MRNKVIITIIVISIVLVGVIIGLLQIEKPKINVSRDKSLSFKSNLNIPNLIAFQENNKWGFYSRSKTVVIEPKYDFVSLPHYFYYSNKYFIVKYNGLWGVIDSLENKIVPFIYDGLDFNENIFDQFIAQKGEDFGVIDFSNKVIIPFKFSKIESWGKYYFVEYKIQSEYALLNNKGTKLFDNLYSWQNKTQRVLGCIDQNGKIVLPLRYAGVEIKDKFLIVSDYDPQKITEVNNKLFGVCDYKGRVLIPLVYDRVDYFKNAGKAVFACYEKNKVRIVDSLNQTIIPYRYNYIYNMTNRNNNIYIFAMNDYLYGVLNFQGEVTVPFEYTSLSDPQNTGMIAAKKNMKAGFVDDNNNVLVAFKYEDVSPFNEGLALVKKISPEYIEGNLRVEGKSEVSTHEFSDYVGQGKLYTENEFYSGMKNLPFREDFYEIIKDNDKRFGSFEEFDLCMTLGDWRKKIPGKYGYIDTEGKVRIDLIFDEAKNFKNGYAEVRIKNKWGVINKHGMVVIPVKYDEIQRSRYKDLFEVYSNNKFIGYVNTNGVEYFDLR